jgi:cytochrome c oxidase cbb3-type subunit 3
MRTAALVVLIATEAALSGCRREKRELWIPPAAAAREAELVMSDLQIGPAATTPITSTAVHDPYEGNAPAVADGQRLYTWFNCAGCHFAGGGGIGPPLMDDVWIYGSDPQNIYDSISSGRPNGMPAFGRRVPRQQIWQLVAYVRALGNLQKKDAVPARSDQMARDATEQPKEQPK